MRLHTFVVLLVCALCACSQNSAPAARTLRDDCLGREDGAFCSVLGEFIRCGEGEVERADDCAAQGQLCLSSVGCALCRPTQYACDGARLLQCSADGTRQEQREVCAEGLSCSEEGCVDLCGRARRERSYIGCEYYPVFTTNNELDSKFQPAVVIANPNLVSAQVSITRGGQPVTELSVAPQAVETVTLPFLEALRTPVTSAIVRAGAYRLTSSVPVTVHQFNPLLYELDEDCARPEGAPNPGTPGDGKCHSYSNDASLLLPSHALVREPDQTLSYLAMARPTMHLSSPSYTLPASPGFVAVVAVGEQSVRVRIRASAHLVGRPPPLPIADPLPTSGSQDEQGVWSEPLPQLAPGESLEGLTLQPGDVVQLLSNAPDQCPEVEAMTIKRELACPLGADFDLTGTLIEADGPVQVIAGHNCAYVPFDRVACDHLEESMLPLDTWGTQAIVPRARAGVAQPQVVRILSGADHNQVELVPPVQEPRTLMRGEFFELMTSEHLLVRAQKPIQVAHYLVGQNGEQRAGDPSMSVAIPVEQYRARYSFLSPATYQSAYVSVIAGQGDRVVLDDGEVTGFTSIADSGYQVASVPLDRAGPHQIHSVSGHGIGVLLYGYGAYTSYMLPGGLDLRVLPQLY